MCLFVMFVGFVGFLFFVFLFFLFRDQLVTHSQAPAPEVDLPHWRILRRLAAASSATCAARRRTSHRIRVSLLSRQLQTRLRVPRHLHLRFGAAAMSATLSVGTHECNRIAEWERWCYSCTGHEPTAAATRTTKRERIDCE
jgi:hypothetical protein